MIDNYVIEPKCFKSVESVRYLLEKFGFHQGRVLVTYPSGWISMVRESLAPLPDLQRKRAIEFLSKYRDERLVDRPIEFVRGQDWPFNASNALKSHAVDKAISAAKNEFGITSYDDLEESFFAHRWSGKVPATTDNYRNAVRPLLQISREAILVDPYFQFSRPSRPKVLKAFFNEASSTRCKSFVLYCRESIAANAGLKRFFADAREFCKKALSSDQSFLVRLLDDKDRPHAMHARYIFSRKGGISFDKGFQEEPIETYVDLALVSPELLDELCRLYLNEQHGNFIAGSFAWKDGRVIHEHISSKEA
jgi:hypothetical protein